MSGEEEDYDIQVTNGSGLGSEDTQNPRNGTDNGTKEDEKNSTTLLSNWNNRR